MPRADKRYTAGLMERLNRTVPNTEGRTWHLEEGSTTYGRWWRVSECGPSGELYHDIAAGQTEADMQSALAHYLDGYSAATLRARDAVRDVLTWAVEDYGYLAESGEYDLRPHYAEYRDKSRAALDALDA